MAKKKIIIIGRGGGQNQDLPADIAELQQQIQQLTAERNALSLQLSAVTTELEQANANVNTLTSEKVALQQAVDELNNQITSLNTRIELLEETIKSLGGDVPSGEIIPGGPHNPENDAFEEDFLWIENIDDTDGTITLNLSEAPFMYYSYDDDTEFQKMVSTNVLSIPAHGKIYLRWKGRIKTYIGNNRYNPLISSSNCKHNIGGELKNGGLKTDVYRYLFHGDTKLIDASQLKLTADALTNYCYQDMFSGCTSLTTAPELPATTLVTSCYYYMFSDCTSLKYVKTNAISWNTSSTAYWLYNVAPTGVVEVQSISNIPENSISGIPSGWTKQINTDVKNTINIHNISGLENTISIPNKFSAFKYKTNNDTEYTENPKSTNLTITLKADETLMIKGIYYPSSSSGRFTGITSTENINVSGEVNYTIPYMFYCLFSGNKKLIDASQLKLTANKLSDYCYSNMFYNCTSLTTAPELPATILSDYCYSNMFQNCTILTTAPELPATTLENYCYQYMFQNCTSLTTAPTILPATTLAQSCYYGMLYGCTSLTTASELPATTLVDTCYREMFRGCKKLNSVTFLSTEPFIYNDYQAKADWLNSVSSTGTFRTPIENKEWIETYPRSASAVPSGWTIEYI